MMSGNLFEFGNFDQCLASVHVSTVYNTKFKGQYCLASLTLLDDASVFSARRIKFVDGLQLHKPVILGNALARNQLPLLG